MKTISYILFWLLTYIVPKKNNLYLFVNTNGKSFSGNSKTLYKYILENKKKIKPIYIGNGFIKSNTLKSYFYAIRAKYIFIENDLNQISDYILAYQPGNLKIINLWHGEPIKKIGFDANETSNQRSNNIIYYKLYKNFFNNKVILGTTCSKISKNNLNFSQLTNKFKITGLARNDIFFNRSLIEKNIKKDLNIENKRIILYTPTYRDNGEKYEPIKINDNLIKILKQDNYTLLIKAHQGDNEIIIQEKNNIINISKLDYDIQEILFFTDILVTDYSSIYIDFLLTNKPILFYTFDKIEYLKHRNMYFNYNEVTIEETIIETQEELENIIKNIKIIVNDKKYKTKYLEIKKLFHKYKKGGYCKNILNEILNYEKKNN